MTYYVAWNGQTYNGEPPEGWFLATDERWWPNSARPWPLIEGSRDGRVSISEEGILYEIPVGQTPPQGEISFDAILRVSRTDNTFGTKGIRIQTAAQTLEWGIPERRDDLVDQILQQLDCLRDSASDTNP